MIPSNAGYVSSCRVGVPFTISGHTDNVGGKEYQKWITKVQAQSIGAYLWSHGIPVEHMKITAMGDEDTIATNRTVHGAAMNRRIEIHLRRAPFIPKSL